MPSEKNDSRDWVSMEEIMRRRAGRRASDSFLGQGGFPFVLTWDYSLLLICLLESGEIVADMNAGASESNVL